MKVMKTNTKLRVPDCRNFKQCGRKAKSIWATLCRYCFLSQAVRCGARSSGNEDAKGTAGNVGNPDAKGAGKRSGVRRSAKRALIVKKKGLDLILAGQKKWEIRGSSTAKRGWIHFAESQAGGKLMGRARLVDCFPVSRKSFMRNFHQHKVSSLSMVPYHTPYAWVLEDCEKFDTPFQYEHKQGAVIWVDV